VIAHSTILIASMNRTTLNFLLDSAMALWFAALIWVTLVLRVAFPPATVADGYTLWGVTYDGWNGLQFVLFGGLMLLLLLHVMLHWSWVCGVIANRISRRRGKVVRVDEGSQTIYGVAVLILFFNVVALALAAAYLSVQAPS